jgi:hypothetical protein
MSLSDHEQQILAELEWDLDGSTRSPASRTRVRHRRVDWSSPAGRIARDTLGLVGVTLLVHGVTGVGRIAIVEAVCGYAFVVVASYAGVCAWRRRRRLDPPCRRRRPMHRWVSRVLPGLRRFRPGPGLRYAKDT